MYIIMCNVLRFDFRKYLSGLLIFFLWIYLQNQNSGTTLIKSAGNQNNLTVMRLSLLHPLGTMSHRARRGTWKEKNKLKINTPERENMFSKLEPLSGNLFIKLVFSRICLQMCHFCWDEPNSIWNNSIRILKYHIAVSRVEGLLWNESWKWK